MFIHIKKYNSCYLIRVMIERDDYIQEIKKYIKNYHGISENKQILYFHKVKSYLENNKTLDDYNINENDIINLIVKDDITI